MSILRYIPQYTSWKIFLRWLLASVLYYSGLLHFYYWLRHRQYPIILNYHRFIDPNKQEAAVLTAMYVRPQTFEKHLRYLARHYHVVTMGQLMAWCERPEKTRRPLCAITFDDGWSDNYHHALPLLHKY